MEPWRSIKTLQFLLPLLLVGFITEGQGYKQEVWLYDDEGNGLYFVEQVADLSRFNSYLPRIVRACAIGYWSYFTSANFQGDLRKLGTRFNDSSLTCRTVDGTNFKSIRHSAGNDSSVASISLYEGSNYDEAEILVTAIARTEITTKIQTLTSTAAEDWLLFEGKNLDGKRHCFHSPTDIPYAFHEGGSVSNYNLTTVGSVFRGCDLQELQSYKIQHSL